MSEKITAFKGFDAEWECRGFQYEVGKTYEHEGDVVACQSGFHACTHPLDVFSYYPPAGSKFATVEMAGEIDHYVSGDSKISAAKITITAEIHIHQIVEAAIKHVFDAAKWIKGSRSTGIRGAASATGDQGAASATGDQGAASATGDQGAASATGYQGAASATGYQGAASATGYRGAASATGYRGAASGVEGNAIFLCERNENYDIIEVWAGIVGKNGIKENVFYTLSGGKPVEMEK